MRSWFVLVLALAASVALGRSYTLAEAAEAVRRATGEVLVQAAILDLKPLAEALREAMVKGGVKVYLLTTDSGLTHPKSYAPSLALAGAVVRFAPRVDGEFVVVDRKEAIRLLRGYVGLSLEEAEPAPLVERFYFAFLQGVPFAVEDWVHRLYIREYAKGGGR